eukprot:gene4172-5939_t
MKVFEALLILWIFLDYHNPITVAAGENASSFTALSKSSVYEVSTLPQFSIDATEILVSAVIERSFNQNLYLSMFLVGHKAFLFRPQFPFLMINQSDEIKYTQWKKYSNFWKNFHEETDKSRKIDVITHYYCIIRGGGRLYESINEGFFVPSDTTTDPGLNQNLEILRCPFQHKFPFELSAEQLYLSKKQLKVEIIRSKLSLFEIQTILLNNRFHSIERLFKFNIPWKYRRAGYGFDLSKSNSAWNPWNEWLPSNSSSMKSYDVVSNNVAYLCLATVRPLGPLRMDTGIGLLLENIEHNLMIGFKHIFLGLYLDKSSKHMQRYRLALDVYIRSGQLTLSSMTMNGVDDVAGMMGMAFNDDYARYYHHQQCLYMSKGVADYVALFHASEFLVLKPPISNVIELLNSQKYIEESFSSKLKSSLQPCYYIIQAVGIPDPISRKSKTNIYGPEDLSWVQPHFSGSLPIGPMPAWFTLILHTRFVWLTGWHVCGACSAELLKVNGKNDNNTHPWSDSRINDVNHGTIIRDMQAIMYFYRGHFDQWQLNRPVYSHIDEYMQLHNEQVRDSLTWKGFEMREASGIWLKTRKEIVKRYYPLYANYYNFTRSNSFVNEKYFLVCLSAIRKNGGIVLQVNDQMKTNQKVIAGKKGLMLSGNDWKECDGQKGCKSFIEIMK